MSERGVDPVDEFAARLPAFTPTAERALEVRRSIMAAAEGVRVRGRRRRAIAVTSAVLAAVASVAVAARPLVHGLTDTALTPRLRGQVLASERAVFERSGLPGREIVTLHGGVMRFEVEPLAPGERFAVVVGVHRVEVRGTIFHVTARADRLISVAVAHGRVDVFGPGGQLASLAPGDSWQAAPDPVAEPAAASTTPPAGEGSTTPQARTRRRPRPPAGATASAATASAATAATATAPTRATSAGAASAEADAGTATGSAPDVTLARPGEAEFRDGWAAYDRGDFGRGAALLDVSCRAAGTGGVAEDACFWLAVSLDRARSEADAIAAYRHFLRRWPAERRSDEARIRLASLLVADGQAAAARAILDEAAHSSRPATRAAAGRALRALDRVDRPR